MVDATAREAAGPRHTWAELHLHFEGCIETAVLNAIAPACPPLAPGALRINGWPDGERAFALVLERLTGAAAYRGAMLGLLDRLAREHIAYAEVTLMPVVHAEHGTSFRELWAGISAALDERSGTGPRVGFLFAIPRNAGAAAGFATLRMVETAAHAAIVGIDLAGTETEGTIAPFVPVFAEARRLGLHTVAHAGEFGPAARVRETLRLLRPERIGHGLAAADDSEVLRELVDSGIPLDLSPSSNVAFGAVESLAAHPLRRLHDAGVPLTISTDDPALVGVTLAHEFAVLTQAFGLDAAAVATIAANAWGYAFAADPLAGHSAP